MDSIREAWRNFCNSKFISSWRRRDCPCNATLVKSAPIPKPSKKIPIPKDTFICKALRPSRCENMERHSGDEESKKVRMALLICGQDTYCPSRRSRRYTERPSLCCTSWKQSSTEGVVDSDSYTFRRFSDPHAGAHGFWAVVEERPRTQRGSTSCRSRLSDYFAAQDDLRCGRSLKTMHVDGRNGG